MSPRISHQPIREQKMTVREQQINDALCALDERHRLGQIQRDEYLRHRRGLLEPLCDAASCSAGDTLRRRVPAAQTLPATTAGGPHDEGKPEVASPRGRRVGARLAPMCLVGFAVVASVAVVCWLMTTA